jgi:hypothetical protein
MNKFLRYSFVALLAMCLGNVYADEFKVTFKDCGGSSDDGTKQTTIEGLVAEGGSIFSAVDAAEAYQAREGRGVKLGSSKNPGKMVFTLSPTIKITQIKFNARWYNDKGEQSITVNGKTFTELTADFAEYTVDLDGSEVSEISISTPEKRAYITTLTIIGEATGNTPDPGPDPQIQEINVAKALEIINALADGKTTEEEYKVTGTVKTIDEISTSFGNATFDIVDNINDANVLKVFRAKDANGNKIVDENIVKVNDVVVVQGKLQKYVKNSEVTPEVAQNGKILTVNGTSTNINTIKANTDVNAPVYNLAGQQVEKSYKGLVIKNGKKVINK